MFVMLALVDVTTEAKTKQRVQDTILGRRITMLRIERKIPFSPSDVAACGAFDGENVLFENYDWFLVNYYDIAAAHIRRLCGWYLVGYWRMPKGEI